MRTCCVITGISGQSQRATRNEERHRRGCFLPFNHEFTPIKGIPFNHEWTRIHTNSTESFPLLLDRGEDQGEESKSRVLNHEFTPMNTNDLSSLGMRWLRSRCERMASQREAIHPFMRAVNIPYSCGGQRTARPTLANPRPIRVHSCPFVFIRG